MQLCDFFVGFTGQDFDEIQENSRANLPGIKGCFKSLINTVSNEFDVVIAGNWQAVYYLNNYTAYKMYFVQDYEPYFFKLNERYLLAKLTYELGIHIVSLGKWNIEQITRECNTISKMDSISFPYELSEYKCINGREYKNYVDKSEIKIAVYTKEEGKRIPNILQEMLSQTKKNLLQVV